MVSFRGRQIAAFRQLAVMLEGSCSGPTGGFDPEVSPVESLRIQMRVRDHNRPGGNDLSAGSSAETKPFLFPRHTATIGTTRAYFSLWGEKPLTSFPGEDFLTVLVSSVFRSGGFRSRHQRPLL